MILHENVVIDKDMKTKIVNNTLIFIDRIKLIFANFVAETLDCTVYINPIRQNCKLPCCFVGIYELKKQAMLTDYARYNIGVEIKYIPKDEPSNALSINTVLHTAIALIVQNITDIEQYKLTSIQSDITDNIANITARVTVLEVNVSQAPIIIKAEKEINT